MPVKISVDGKEMVINPTTRHKEEKLQSAAAIVKVDRDFYVYTFNLNGE
jgi:hypothetical protein